MDPNDHPKTLEQENKPQKNNITTRFTNIYLNVVKEVPIKCCYNFSVVLFVLLNVAISFDCDDQRPLTDTNKNFSNDEQ